MDKVKPNGYTYFKKHALLWLYTLNELNEVFIQRVELE